MLKTNFKDYKEFKELYVREDGKIKNAILMAFTSSKAMQGWYADIGRSHQFKKIKDMNQLFAELVRMLQLTLVGDAIKLYGQLLLRSTTYSMDDQMGICLDGDTGKYRYLRNGKPYKMNTGRFVNKIIDESPFGRLLPHQCRMWLCEEIGARHKSYAEEMVNSYTLVVDDDFMKIYDRTQYLNGMSMSSCMQNQGAWTFYRDAVDASAASLRNGNGDILARCIIYNNVVQSTTGKTFRLGERQYSIGSELLYQRLLVQKLIDGGFIDAYKPVGAGCHSPESWVDTAGNPLEHTKFHIKCKLDIGDAVSYQDSFKWYDPSSYIAYNFEAPGCGDEELATTSGEYAPHNYDSWNEEYVSEELYQVFADGEAFYTTEYTRDRYFCYVEDAGEYHHQDNVVWCACCEVYVPIDDAWLSDITHEYYCSEECRDKAEERYEKEHETLFQ